MITVSYEVASQLVEGWLDYKKIKERKREAFSEAQEALVQAVMDGELKLDELYNMTYMLNVPIEDENGEVVIDKLVFKPRLKVSEVETKKKGLKGDDPDNKILAYIAGSTLQNTAIIKKLDTADYNFCSNIILFFL